MKIALAQIDIKAGKPSQNIINILAQIKEAKIQGVDIIVFPEMCIGGYLIGDRWLDDNYCRYLMEFNQQIIDASENICVIWGNVYLDDREYIDAHNYVNHDTNTIRNVHYDGRRRRFNTAYVFQNKKTVSRFCGQTFMPDGLQFKTLLPNYREFDDKRYFASALDLLRSNILLSKHEVNSPFQININGKTFCLGVELCEDLWCEDYDWNPTKIMYGRSDAIVNLSASPWTYGKNGARDRKVKNVSIESKCRYSETIPFLYVNCIGVQNNGKNFFTFDGGSTVYGDNGEPKITAKNPYKEELIICDIDKLPHKTIKRPSNRKIAEKYNAIVRGIQHLVELTGLKKFVIGLSGGIDSAIDICLLEKAVGKENIIAVNMPSIYNSDITKNAAQKLANNLGINDYRIVPIVDIINSKIKTIFRGQEVTELAQENIQAETRGMILSAIAGNEKAFFVCNANKIELATGYGTLNGDLRGAICPIGDLTKQEVYDMMRYLNDEVYQIEMIPEVIYNIKPSAELKNNQTDPIKIGYHCKIIEQFMDYMKKSPADIMQWWLDCKLEEKLDISSELINRYNLNDPKIFIEDLEWFCSKIHSSVFKRVQSVPIIVLSKTSFGYDLRESILPNFEFTAKERMLKQKILKQK